MWVQEWTKDSQQKTENEMIGRMSNLQKRNAYNAFTSFKGKDVSTLRHVINNFK